ncbi:MAG TPA: hypothetical protein VHO03_08045 [Ignavibacteriales bacterium]|nr:hypothetical protein [Ignavibacteriales bacterium]
MEETNSNVAWYTKPFVIVLFLIVFFPLGAFLLMKTKLWSVLTRQMVLILGSLIFFVIFLATSSRFMYSPLPQNSESATFENSSNSNDKVNPETVVEPYTYPNLPKELIDNITGEFEGFQNVAFGGFNFMQDAVLIGIFKEKGKPYEFDLKEQVGDMQTGRVESFEYRGNCKLEVVELNESKDSALKVTLETNDQSPIPKLEKILFYKEGKNYFMQFSMNAGINGNTSFFIQAKKRKSRQVTPSNNSNVSQDNKQEDKQGNEQDNRQDDNLNKSENILDIKLKHSHFIADNGKEYTNEIIFKNNDEGEIHGMGSNDGKKEYDYKLILLSKKVESNKCIYQCKLIHEVSNKESDERMIYFPKEEKIILKNFKGIEFYKDPN